MENVEQKPHRKPGRPRKYGQEETEFVHDPLNERTRSNQDAWKERNRERWLEYQREYQRKYREAHREKFREIQKDHIKRKRQAENEQEGEVQ